MRVYFSSWSINHPINLAKICLGKWDLLSYICLDFPQWSLRKKAELCFTFFPLWGQTILNQRQRDSENSSRSWTPVFIFPNRMALCFFPYRGNDSGQSISKECKNWMWAIFLEGCAHQCVTIALTQNYHWISRLFFFHWWEELNNHNLADLVRSCILRDTHAGAEPPQSSSETRPAVGAGRRSCYQARQWAHGTSPPSWSCSVLTYLHSVCLKESAKSDVPFSTCELIMED